MKKSVLVSVDRGETRVALLEANETVAARKPAASSSRRRRRTPNLGAGWKVAELYLERRGARSIVGNIYKGRVDNVLAGLEAAFVDIGLEKNGFLHVDEIVMPGVDAPRRGRGAGREARQITDMLKPGQEVVVQVVKDPLKSKGARLSMDLTIAGRYMVYAPFGEGVGVSRRLDDGERERLRKEAAKLDLKGAGAIIRTAAQGAGRADLERELLYLFKLGEVLQKRVAETPAPALVFQEADLSVRVVRDIYSSAFERAIVDDAKQHHRLISFFSRTAPELVEHVELWEEEKPLFEAFGVEQVLESTLNRRVDLPSGGYLMIDYAEALTVIDVNSGSFIGRGKGARLEDTITKTNLEAAEEVVRQLRLRDIGGIIVIDFIDMARARNRDAVLKELRKALDEDRTKTFVVEISPLGLVEMTRQNVTDGVREIMTRPCPTCDGNGVIKSEETIAIEFDRRMRDLAAVTDAEALLLQMNPRVSAEFTANDARVLRAIEDDTGKWFHFEGSEGLPLEHFSVILEGTREKVLERAVPFRAGEEVHVDIVEPHMYSPGDAVAKVDGYIISITGGERFVGEKHLVRIEDAGRTAAVASLIDVEVPVPEPPAPGRERSGRSRASARTGSGAAGAGSRSRSGARAREATASVGGTAGAEAAAENGRAGTAAAQASEAEREPEVEPGANVAAGVDGDSAEDALESTPRRRGRRGGRRRSGARAESASAAPASD
ncbi:MAG: Rne/Rng family ribonuclease [Solirubrobacterales bacterium]|nr:Rne/Rng family ribonuclease [Solirubrobacterales bacterium]MBV9715988.1 Rne/Rng family ribonuclease [Solirubrobacterales bacterium]